MVVALQCRGQNRAHHLDVRDPIFVVGIADRLEPEFAIESHQIHLCPDPDWLAGEQIHCVHDRLTHKEPPDSGAPYFGMGNHPPDRRLGEPHSGRHDARIGKQNGMFVASQKMPSTGINTVSVDVRTVLLYYKDTLPELQQVIQIVKPEFGVWVEVPTERRGVFHSDSLKSLRRGANTNLYGTQVVKTSDRRTCIRSQPHAVIEFYPDTGRGESP